jgi:glycosyltransferase involved in cell wall biosynthesis
VTILVVGPEPPPTTGRAVVTAAQVAAWRAGGTSVALASVALGGRGAAGQVRKLSRYLAALGRVVRSGRDTGVALVASDGPWLVADVVVALAARRRRLAIHHHNWGPLAQRSALMAVLVKAAGRAARHVVLGPAMAAALRDRYGAGLDVVVVSNAAVVPPAPATPSAGGRLVLGMLGNLTAAKGLLRALAVLDAARAEDLDVALVLAGPVHGDDERAAVAAAQRLHGDRVEALGPVDADGRAAFLARCDLLLFPSDYRNEAQPMAVLEALAAGVPVVAVERGCLADDLAGLGWTVPEVDGFPALAADAVARLADPAERARWSALAADRHEDLGAAAHDQLRSLATWLTDRP